MDWQNVVTNLLKKAEDPAATEAERTAFTERAMYLMAKYGITERLTAVEPQTIQTATFEMQKPYKTHKIHLLYGITLALGGKAVQSRDVMYVFGTTSDLERIKILYESLLIQGLLGVTLAQIPPFENGKTYKHNWLLHFVGKVVERVQAAAQRANQEVSAPGTELVLASSAARIDTAVSRVFPRLKVQRYTYDRDSTGKADGAHAGNLADIGQSRVGGSVRQISGNR